jgi:hypothetical protein
VFGPRGSGKSAIRMQYQREYQLYNMSCTPPATNKATSAIAQPAPSLPPSSSVVAAPKKSRNASSTGKNKGKATSDDISDFGNDFSSGLVDPTPSATLSAPVTTPPSSSSTSGGGVGSAVSSLSSYLTGRGRQPFLLVSLCRPSETNNPLENFHVNVKRKATAAPLVPTIASSTMSYALSYMIGMVGVV